MLKSIDPRPCLSGINGNGSGFPACNRRPKAELPMGGPKPKRQKGRNSLKISDSSDGAEIELLRSFLGNGCFDWVVSRLKRALRAHCNVNGVVAKEMLISYNPDAVLRTSMLSGDFYLLAKFFVEYQSVGVRMSHFGELIQYEDGRMVLEFSGSKPIETVDCSLGLGDERVNVPLKTQHKREAKG